MKKIISMWFLVFVFLTSAILFPLLLTLNIQKNAHNAKNKISPWSAPLHFNNNNWKPPTEGSDENLPYFIPNASASGFQASRIRGEISFDGSNKVIIGGGENGPGLRYLTFVTVIQIFDKTQIPNYKVTWDNKSYKGSESLIFCPTSDYTQGILFIWPSGDKVGTTPPPKDIAKSVPVGWLQLKLEYLQ